MARRSVLFAPGDQPDVLRKATDTDADVVIYDLEDGVAPSRKAAARSEIADVLRERNPEPEVAVRVNPLGAGAEADLAALPRDAPPDAVVASKVSDPDEVASVRSALDDLDRVPRIFAFVESAAGVLNADSIAAAPGVEVLCIGAEDLTAEIGGRRTDEGTEVLYARQRIVLAAAAAGVDAVDTVYTDFEDDDGLREEVAFCRQLGFDGKVAIHPRQVRVINDAFTPGRERLEWARRVLDARERADSDESGVVVVDGEMVDAPHFAQAERILARAEAAGLDVDP